MADAGGPAISDSLWRQELARAQRVRSLRIVRPFGDPVVPRARMSLTQVYEAGVGAGGETNGVYAVWLEGRGKSVIAEDGAYIGPVGVTTPWPLRTVKVPHECLPQKVYDRFKEARGSMTLEEALRVIEGLGRSWDSSRAELAAERG